ncbi:MAG: type IV pilus modification PilV family protein [Planctomycetota bacterium]
MSTSAERRPAPRARPARSTESGFTLLEVLASLAIVALAVVPMLVTRDQAWNIAYRSGHLLRAANYAQELLAERLDDPERLKDHLGFFDDDPSFRYEISLEDYDLSTGRVIEEDDPNGFSQETKFSTTSAFMPADAKTVTAAEEDSPHRVRRVKIKIWYEGLEDGEPSSYVLEGFVPRATEIPPGTQQP